MVLAGWIVVPIIPLRRTFSPRINVLLEFMESLEPFSALDERTLAVLLLVDQVVGARVWHG